MSNQDPSVLETLMILGALLAIPVLISLTLAWL